MTFFDGDRKLGERYHGRGVQARWAGVNGVPPLIHAGGKLTVHFLSEDRGKCDKIFGYSFIVSAIFDERHVTVEEQRFADLGCVIKNELKRVVFKRLLDSTTVSSESVAETLPTSMRKGHLAQLLSENWNCDDALTFLHHQYSLFVDSAYGDVLAQTLCQVPLSYEAETLKSFLKHHCTSVPRLHLSSLRSFGARISENLQSFTASPCKESCTAFAMTEQVFFSGLHEFSVVFETEAPLSASSTPTNSFGIGVASTSALDLVSDGVFFLSSVGEIKRMGGQVNVYEACSPPCIGHPIHVTLDLTIPKISIRQLGRVLIEQNLPPSLVSSGVYALFMVESSDDTSLASCRCKIDHNHTPDASAFQYIHFLASIVSHKLFSDIACAAPLLQDLQPIILSNAEHLKRMCGLVLKQFPECEVKKRAFWEDLSSSPSHIQLFFLQSCLHAPKNPQMIAHYLPVIEAAFRQASAHSSWACSLEKFELQLIIVMLAVASLASNSSDTLSSIICESPRDSPLVSSMHRSMVDAAAASQRPTTFLAQALKVYAEIGEELKTLPGDALVIRSILERAKREAADSIVSLCISETPSEGGLMLQTLLSVLNSDSDSHFPHLVTVLSSIPSHVLHRSLLLLLITCCKKLLMGQCSYSQAAIDFVAYSLCASSRGSFSASRRALKHIHSAVSSVWPAPGLHFINFSRAALSSVGPSFASVLEMRFNHHPIVSFVNAGWAVVAAGAACARISVAAACVLCAVIQSNGGSCSALSQISGIPEGALRLCLETLCHLGLVQLADASDGQFFSPTKLCATEQSSDRFAPVLESVHEPELSLECNFMDKDFIDIVQGILAVLPRTAFVSESALSFQCSVLTQASPGKISHVLMHLESKGLICRDGEYIALMSPLVESCAQQHEPSGTRVPLELPGCILQLVITVPISIDTFPFDAAASNSVCIPKSNFETFLGKSFSHILPLTGIDQLQLSDRFIESDACVATILFSLHCNNATVPQTGTRSEFLVNTGFCPVCLDFDAELISPLCGHGACFQCWEGYISTALDDDNTQTVNQGSEDRLHLTKLKCIADHSCDTPLSIEFLSRVSPSVASSMVRVLQKSMCRSILSVSTCIVQCQFCDVVIVAPNELCEAQCARCGRIKAAGDFKRNTPDLDWISHPKLKSGDLAAWQAMNQQGSVERYELMRFKKCPRCGAATTRCGCQDSKVICDGLERCPNERCDQCCPPCPSPPPTALLLCQLAPLHAAEPHCMPLQHDVRQLQLQLVRAAMSRCLSLFF